MHSVPRLCWKPGRLEERRPKSWVAELTLDVSTGEFLSAERGFTYADLYTMWETGVRFCG
jgi:hypothetical protein